MDDNDWIASASNNNEVSRLAELTNLHILDTEAEYRFDMLTSLALEIIGGSNCLMSLLDEHRQWFKSSCTNTMSETHRDNSFCKYLINDAITVLRVNDTRNDGRFNAIPLVTEEPKIAAYLVVASTVEHAHQIARVIEKKFKRSVTIVSYHNNESQDILNNFQQSTTEWLVAVGMVSEGTNIPRLQVCCHLSRIRTELHFRQVLGRIMRLTLGEKNIEAHLFSPALPQLIEYSNRLHREIPVVCDVKRLVNERPGKLNIIDKDPSQDTIISLIVNEDVHIASSDVSELSPISTLDDSFFSSIMFKGPFIETVIHLPTRRQPSLALS